MWTWYLEFLDKRGHKSKRKISSSMTLCVWSQHLFGLMCCKTIFFVMSLWKYTYHKNPNDKIDSKKGSLPLGMFTCQRWVCHGWRRADRSQFNLYLVQPASRRLRSHHGGQPGALRPPAPWGGKQDVGQLLPGLHQQGSINQALVGRTWHMGLWTQGGCCLHWEFKLGSRVQSRHFYSMKILGLLSIKSTRTFLLNYWWTPGTLYTLQSSRR